MGSRNKVDLVLFGWVIFTQLRCGLTQPGLYTDEDFLQRHNNYRQMLLDGKVPNQPIPKHLPPLRWNPNLKESARRWAVRCVYAHERSCGQGDNLAASRGYLPDPVEMWFIEHEYYKFKPIIPNEPIPVGHYTQIVAARTTDLGCYMHVCPELTISSTLKWNSAYYTVCRYSPPGNILGMTPYEPISEDAKTNATTATTIRPATTKTTSETPTTKQTTNRNSTTPILTTTTKITPATTTAPTTRTTTTTPTTRTTTTTTTTGTTSTTTTTTTTPTTKMLTTAQTTKAITTTTTNTPTNTMSTEFKVDPALC